MLDFIHPTLDVPRNLEAEQALLGALLINNQSAEYIPELSSDHFFDPIHAQMFAAMSEALLAGRPFTATTLSDKFRTTRIDEKTDGAQYLGRLISRATTIINVQEYARTIIDAAQRRTLVILAEDLIARALDASDPASPSELIDDAERRLFQVSDRGKSGRETTLVDAVKKAIDAVNQAGQNGGKLDGIESGFRDIDKKMGGLGNGNLVIIGGRPSMGKTALATNMAVNVAMAGDHVHFFSQEMTAVELAMRQLGEHANVPSDKLRRGSFTEAEFMSVIDAGRRLSGLSMTIDETGGISLASLAAKARRMKRKKGTKLIVVDYLQLMQPSGRSSGGNRVQDITEITIGLKALAKELNVPIIALSQLSRALESRADKRPQLSDLRESGSIEQDADAVLFVYREEYYIERTKPSETDMMEMVEWEDRMRKAAGKAEVIIGKQRHGSVGIVEMAFNGPLTRFSDMAREYAS